MRKIIRSDDIRCVLFVFVVIFIPYFGLKTIAALQCYPALDGDSWYFAISAVEYEQTGIARQPFTTFLANPDTAFFPHGYLYQIVLTKLSPVIGYQGIYISNIILFAIYAILFFLLCSDAGVNCLVVVGTLILSMRSIGPSTFRPELLAADLILGWILLMKQMELSNSDLMKNVLSACALVLLAITQPTIGILSAAILSYWMVYHRGAKALSGIALIALLTVLSIAAITEFLTGSFLTWIESISAHGQTVGYPFSYRTFAHLALLLVELLWIGIIPAAVLATYTHFKKLSHFENNTDKVLLTAAALICIIIYFCYQFIFYLPRTFYEAFTGPRYFIELFVPISIVLLWRAINDFRSGVARAAFILVLLVPVAGAGAEVARDAVVTAIDLIRSDTVSFSEVQKKIDSMLGKEPLAVDGVFIPAIEGDAKSLLVGTFRTTRFLDGGMSDLWGQERAGSEACAIVIRQINTGLEAPPEIKNFTMVETTFSSPVRLFGLTFYRTPKGYNYTVYHRVTCR